ncbi:uncharacterized protein (DUF2384 family) [Nocardioides daedukensis]|uniref:Uncharacterized protein (DUF2384 family) n=1 Tax=Nocardioides daedukensis TaxID=634462 RepID=A0A7Y9RY01_9ACTN|nr:hypothetical protein [Nocardioides daedukensis]NYG58762.1 uncharacterized protein (DUF2384 family) [Nocardioides daedukensis]
MNRLLALVISLLAAWLAGAPAATAAAPADPVTAIGYDARETPAHVIDTTSERGPPAAHNERTTYDAVDSWSNGDPARPGGTTPPATFAYDHPARFVQTARGSDAVEEHSDSAEQGSVLVWRSDVAANGGSKIPWTSWQNYPKATQGGREYAQVGDRLYTRHAVDRMQPSGLGAPAGAPGPGRSISPNYIEDVLTGSRGVPVKGPNGEPRLSFTSGTVQVITENNIVITVITR